jgi:hypothetical protein
MNKIVFFLALITFCYADLTMTLGSPSTLDIKFSVAKVFEAKENELTDDSGVESYSELANKLEYDLLNRVSALEQKTILEKTEEVIPLDVDNELLSGKEAEALEQEYVQHLKIQEKIQERSQLAEKQNIEKPVEQEEILENGIEEIIQPPKVPKPVLVEEVKINSVDLLAQIETTLTQAQLVTPKRDHKVCLSICNGQKGMDSTFCNKVCSGKTATF